MQYQLIKAKIHVSCQLSSKQSSNVFLIIYDNISHMSLNTHQYCFSNENSFTASLGKRRHLQGSR